MGWEITAWVVPTVFWLFVGAIILVPMWLRSRERRWIHDTLKVAYEKSQPVNADFVMALRESAQAGTLSTAERDLRRAVLFFAAALGAGILAYALSFGRYFEDELSATINMGLAAGAAVILAIVSLVHFAFWLLRRRGPTDHRADAPN